MHYNVRIRKEIVSALNSISDFEYKKLEYISKPANIIYTTNRSVKSQRKIEIGKEDEQYQTSKEHTELHFRINTINVC